MPWTVTAAARPATVGQLEMFVQAFWSSDELYGKDTMLQQPLRETARTPPTRPSAGLRPGLQLSPLRGFNRMRFARHFGQQ